VDAALRLQDGLCALCLRAITAETCFVDHDHALAGSHGHREAAGCLRCFRGLLCGRCNGFLVGEYGEPGFLLRAASYAGHRRGAD